jgi:hypothetical protein
VKPAGKGDNRPRLLLVGAGPTEVGKDSPWTGGEPDLHGAVLPCLLDRLLVAKHRLAFPQEDRLYSVPKVQSFDGIKTIPSKTAGRRIKSLDGEKVRLAMVLAKIRGYHGVVVLIDRESLSQPDRAQRMKDGRESYRSSAPDKGPACAIGAACRAIETWLLADAKARAEVFGPDAPDPFSGNPEERPPPRELKQYIADKAAKANLSQAQAYVDLARASSPDEIGRRCVTSYPPFADEVHREIQPLVAD